MELGPGELSEPRGSVASSLGPTQILSRSAAVEKLRDKIWVGPGDEASGSVSRGDKLKSNGCKLFC